MAAPIDKPTYPPHPVVSSTELSMAQVEEGSESMVSAQARDGKRLPATSARPLGRHSKPLDRLVGDLKCRMVRARALTAATPDIGVPLDHARLDGREVVAAFNL